MGCNISMAICFVLFGVCKPKSCNILNLLFVLNVCVKHEPANFGTRKLVIFFFISFLSVRIIYA